MNRPARCTTRSLLWPALAAALLVAAPWSLQAASRPGGFAPSAQAAWEDAIAAAEDEDGDAQAPEDGEPDAKPGARPDLGKARRLPGPGVGGPAPLGINPRAPALRPLPGGAQPAENDGNKVEDEEGRADPPPSPGAARSQAANEGRGGAAKQAGDDKASKSEEWSTEESRKRSWEAKPPPKNLPVKIDFVDSDLKDVVKYFSELTGRNFILTDGLSAKITIMSPTPVTAAEAYEAFLAALDAAGYTTVVEGRFTRIIKNESAAREPVRFYKGEFVPETANFVTRLIRVQNVTATDVSQVIEGMIGPGANLKVYVPTNTLILTDSANNIRRLQDLIEELDVSAPKSKLEVVKIQYAEAADLLEKINAIYGTEGTASSGGRGAPASPRTPAARPRPTRGRDAPAEPAPSTTGTVGDEGRLITKMIADERTNSIIILATESALKDVFSLIAQLDYEVDPWAKSDIHVVYLQHAKAADLAQVLANLTTQGSQTGTQPGRRGSGPGQQTAGRNAAGAAGATGTQGRQATQRGQGAEGTDAAGGISATFESGVRVTADEATNALVITASRDDFRALKSVIEKLDVRRKQVFVETVIMEISDSNILGTDASFHAGAPAGKDASVIGGLNAGSLLASLADPTLLAGALTGAAIGIIGNSIDTGLTDLSGNPITIPAFGILLSALQTDISTNILSSPDLLTLANEEAEIVVGETVPFSTGGTLTQTGLPSFNITREDVALTLRMTPQINEGNEVRLEVYQEISRVKGSQDVGNGLKVPITTKRSAKAVIAASDNQTIVLGGLMETQDSDSEYKVPVLGDIPLIGALFRSRDKVKTKTNLLIFLTPHIIEGPQDLEEVYRIKMLQREEFMRRFYGKSAAEQQEEFQGLLRYSMNLTGVEKAYRDKPPQVHAPEAEDSPGTGRDIVIGPDAPPDRSASPQRVESPVPPEAPESPEPPEGGDEPSPEGGER